MRYLKKGDSLERLISKIYKTSLFALITILISKLIWFPIRIFLARLGPENFGNFLLGTSLIAFFVYASNIFINASVIKRVSRILQQEKKNKLKVYFTSHFVFVLIQSLIILFIAYILNIFFIDYIFPNSQIKEILFILGILIPLKALSNFCYSFLVGINKIKIDFFFRNILTNLLFLSFILVQNKSEIDIQRISISYVAANSITFLILLYILRKQFVLNYSIRNKELKNSILVSAPLFLGYFASSIIYHIDNYSIGFFLDSSQIGIYGVSVTLVTLAMTLPLVINPIIFRYLSDMFYNDRYSKFKNNFWMLFWQINLLKLVSVIILLLFIEQAIQIIFGAEYIYSLNIVIILIIGKFFHENPLQFLLILHNKTKVLMLLTTILAISNLLLNIVMISFLGIIGVAISTSSIMILSFIITISYLKRENLI